MISIFVCDDSEFDISCIKTELERYEKNKHTEFKVSYFNNPEMLLYELQDGKIPDVFILDVEMPQLSGFELAEKIREYTDTSVIIFLTSHDDLATMGYKSRALRYVIKVNMKQEIEEALDSAIKELSSISEKTITLHRYNDYWHISYNDIISVTRISRQLIIDTNTRGELTDGRGIKDLFNLLNDSRFLFIDRSCFVNIDYISGINGNNLKLKNGKELPISRRSLQNVKQTLIAYWG